MTTETTELPDRERIAEVLGARLDDIDPDPDYWPEGYEGPGLDVTLGWTPATGTWAIQTGDNSFTGPVYGHPFWAVGTLTPDCDCLSLADELIDQLAETLW